MVSRLFRSRKDRSAGKPVALTAQTAADRLQAIRSLTEEQAASSADTLLQLARQDPDAGVRKAAVNRLTDPERLGELLTSPECTTPAAHRLAELIESGSHTGYEQHPAVLAARLARAPTPTLVQAILDLDDPALLAQAALALPRTERQRLLEEPAFSRGDVLHSLERLSRNHDKATNRIARARLEAIRRDRSEAEERLSQIHARLDSLEGASAANRAEGSADDQAARLEQRRLRALADAAARDLEALTSLVERLGTAREPVPDLEALRARLEDASARIGHPAAPASQESASSIPPPAASSERKHAVPDPTGGRRFDELAAAFEALDARLEEPLPFEQLTAERQALTDAWLEHADHEPPSPAQHAIFERTSHRYQMLREAWERLSRSEFGELHPDAIPERITDRTPESAWQAARALRTALKHGDRLLAEIRWPGWAPEPQSVAEYRSAMEQARRRLKSWEQAVEAFTTELTERLDALDAQIDRGELKEAQAEASRLRRALNPIPEQQVRPLERRLGRAQARLGELGDWQAFATSPKRAALVEQLESLTHSPLPPRDQANRIRALRDEWNALGPLTSREDHRLMDAFNEAAERAFEPCRAYFAELAQQRAANLEARRQICNDLAEYIAVTDWTNADYKAAERILRTARQEWQRFHPVERREGKQLEKRFEALQSELHGHIKAEWDRNLASKRAIVEEAQAVAAADSDHSDKVSTIKALQARWKAVGSTPRRPDQALWRQFRAACDAVFEAQNQARKAAETAIDARADQARALLGDFRARLDRADRPLTASEIRTVQQQFEELANLPERTRRPLVRELDELVKTAQTVLRAQRHAQTRARLSRLKALDVDVAELETRLGRGDSLTYEPPDPLFAERGRPGEVPVDDILRLTLEAEIAAGLESPETDARMALQVELMNSGRTREVLNADPEALVARWCELGPKDSSIDPLRERFFSAIDRLAA